MPHMVVSPMKPGWRAATLLAAMVLALSQGCTSRDVVGVEVETIGVQPSSATILEGDSVQLRVVARDSRGLSIEGAEPVWSVRPDSAATVSRAGVVRGLRPGTVEVTATFGSMSASAQVSILSGPTVDPSRASLIFHLDRDARPHADQTLDLRNAGGGAVSGLTALVVYGVGATDWLDVELAANATPTTLTATPQTAGITPGRYSAAVRILSATSPDDTLSIPVSMSLASVTVSESAGSTVVDERGSSDQFSVSLDLRPDTDVLLDVSSADPGEATVSPTNLRFTPADWASPQAVTVTGVGDDQSDGSQSTAVTVAVNAAASDPAYAPLGARTVMVRTLDAVGLSVRTFGGVTRATEGGATDSLRLVLDLRPSREVVVDLTVDDTDDATVSPSRLTFSPMDWDRPKTVTFRAVDDAIADGNRERIITISVDPSSDTIYAGRPPLTVSASTEDNETASFSVRETGGRTEAVEGGRTDSVTVVLDVAPLSAAVLDVSIDDRRDATVGPTALAFTGSNWNVPQVVVFSAVDDPDGDGNQVRTLTVSVNPVSDPAFASLPARTVTATTIDNESAVYVVSETGGSTVALEGGATDSISIVLGARASDDVTFDIAVDDTKDATVSPTSVTFSPDGWDIPRWIVFRAVDDPAVDGPREREIRVSVDRRSDPSFRDLPDRVITATTLDDDGAGFSIDESGDTTIVSEDGSTDAFTVVLETRPLTSVVFDVTSGDTGEATVQPSRLTFTPESWDTRQTVTVTGVDDDIGDGSQHTAVRISVAAESDLAFRGLPAQVVTATTTDDDAVGILVTESDGTVVSEDGSQADAVQVRLAARPSADVVVAIGADDASEVAVTPTTLTFTTNNWSTARSVAVTGVDDDIADGDVVSTISFAVAPGSGDAAYDTVSARIVNVVTLDDEIPGISVVESNGRTLVGESGPRDTLSVTLSVAPLENVRLKISDENTGEITLGTDRLDFTPTNWDVPQLVVVEGRNDSYVDGDQTTAVTIEVEDRRSDDAWKDVADVVVEVTTVDDDVAGFSFTGTDGTESVGERSGDRSFGIVLTGRPTSGVVLTITSADESEVEVDPVEVSFSPKNWNDPKTVTLKGKDDAWADGDQVTTVTVSVDRSKSNDAFDGVPDRTLQVTTLDDEDAGFRVSGTADLTVSESGISETFSIRLDGRPETPVVLSIASSDPGEVASDVTTVRFTDRDWDKSQKVTLTGVGDDTPDGDQVSTVTVAVVVGESSPAFATLAAQTFQVTTTDVDTESSASAAGFDIVGADDLTIEEGRGESFTVALKRAPRKNRNVVITVVSSDPGEVRVRDTVLRFDDEDWHLRKQVRLRGERDRVADGDKTTRVTVAVNDPLSDPDFRDVPDQVVSVRTIDADDADRF